LDRLDGRTEPEYAPEDANLYHLGTHPDLVEMLWNKVTADVPMSCAHVVYGRPALVHPANGVIFGFAGGTSILALRLPLEVRESIIGQGLGMAEHEYPKSVWHALDFGDDWVFIKLYAGSHFAAWGKESYDYAESLGRNE
jgi:hypothetical protein